MQAVILAAGLGSRIREQHSLPKGFLQIGHDYIINESLQCLFSHGISRVLIVTGYGLEYYNQLAQQDVRITTQYNEYFHRYGSLYSLYCAKNWIKESFLLLESDIIYEPRALKELIQSPASNAIVVSGFSHSEDEVFVMAQNTKLIKMSKAKSDLDETLIQGEFVGITKLSLDAYKELIHRLEHQKNLLQKGHYDEDGLVDLAAQQPIHCIVLPDLLWSEIDNQAHFIRAKKIYAAMRTK